MNQTERFHSLLQKYLKNDLSLEEHDEFFDMVESGRFEKHLHQSLGADLSDGFMHQTDLPPHIAQDMVRRIYEAEKGTAKVLPAISRNKFRKAWMVAASLLLLIAVGYWFPRKKNSAENIAWHPQVSSTAHLLSEENRSAQARVVWLSDSTAVTLQPSSTIHYPHEFNTATREVYLQGEAFFQVKRNESKPFLVYYNNIVTKVLGTSFTVHTDAKTGHIEVLVETGRVQVYENESIKAEGKPGSIIVTPNQKAIYETDKRSLITALVDKPQPLNEKEIASSSPDLKFIYELESLGIIFRDLEAAYGIEIVPENGNLKNCVFTGDVTSQDLFTKLKIICLTTNSTYEINGTRILIKGSGCQ